MNENCLTVKDKKLLLDLICNEQVRMIVKDSNNYMSDRYIHLEKLKINVKDM